MPIKGIYMSFTIASEFYVHQEESESICTNSYFLQTIGKCNKHLMYIIFNVFLKFLKTM